MSNVIKFDFDVTYKEIDINGKLYRMDMNDNARERMLDVYDRAREIAEQGAGKDPEKMTKEEIKAVMDKEHQFAIEMVDAFLGEGTGEELYEVCGRSTANLTKLSVQLRDMYEGFGAELYQEEKKKYVKKGK